MPKTQINCPQCRQPIVADVQQLFDVGVDPQAKQIFLSGAFNIAQCPHCHFQGMLATPLIYHDPEKELLLTYFPTEMMLPREEQARILGPIINRVVNSLPQEKRKGYLLNPKSMFTLQTMLETVLEADGITKEMIMAQENRMRLIQRLLAATGDARAKTIQEEDALIDEDFFALLSRLMEAALVGRDQNSARQISELQKSLLEHSTTGKAFRAETQEMEAAAKSLQELGEGITREQLLELVLRAPGDTRLETLVRLARPGMDYQFLQLLSQRIERARGEGRERLIAMREKILELIKQIDQETAARVELARKNLEILLQATNLEEAVQQNIEAIDDLFMQVVSSELENARKAGNLDRSARLQQIVSIVEKSAGPPPEIEFIEMLLDFADDPLSLQQALEAQADEITPELLQVLSSLINQGQTVVAEMQGERKTQQQEILGRIQKVYEAALRFSMRRSFNVN